MLFVVDLDDTLFDSASVFIEALNASTGQSKSNDYLWTYDLARLYGLSVEEVHSVFIEHKCLERAPWFDGQSVWQELSHRIVDAGHSLIYATQRGWHPDALDITRHALEGCAGTPVIIPFSVPKVDWLQEQGYRPDVLVDDNTYYVTESSRRFGTYAVLASRRWNYMDTWGNRSTDIQSIKGHLERML